MAVKWKDVKTYNVFNWRTVIITRNSEGSPRKFYCELRKGSRYLGSYGSNMPTEKLAVIAILIVGLVKR